MTMLTGDQWVQRFAYNTLLIGLKAEISGVRLTNKARTAIQLSSLSLD